jgi:hypothetical protein
MVRTTVQTPRFCGAPFGCLTRRCLFELYVYCKAGALLFTFLDFRPFRTNWLIVGTFASKYFFYYPITEAIERTVMASRLIRNKYSVGNMAGVIACLSIYTTA